MKKTTGFLMTAIGSIVVYEALRRNGVLDRVKGSFEQEYGKLTQDPKLQAKGLFHSTKGEVKDVIHDVKESVEDSIEEITE